MKFKIVYHNEPDDFAEAEEISFGEKGELYFLSGSTVVKIVAPNVWVTVEEECE